MLANASSPPPTHQNNQKKNEKKILFQIRKGAGIWFPAARVSFMNDPNGSFPSPVLQEQLGAIVLESWFHDPRVNECIKSDDWFRDTGDRNGEEETIALYSIWVRYGCQSQTVVHAEDKGEEKRGGGG